MTIKHCIDSLRKKGLYFCLQEASKYIFPVRWISDKGIMDILYQNRTYHYLKRKYIPMLDKFTPSDTVCSDVVTPIWVAWLQGEDEAPMIVKKCIESIRENAGEHEVRLVTWENIDSYVEIPPYIVKRLNKHQMQFAQFSDYLRLALLSKWGGIWLDATVMLTGRVPEAIETSQVFFLKGQAENSGAIRASSWFIVSRQGNHMIQKLKYLLECYWKREHRLKDYFIFHIFLSCLIDSDEECRALWNDMHFINNQAAHRMQSVLFFPFSDRLFNDIISGSTIHKLSYKFKDYSMLEKEGTVYKYLLNPIPQAGCVTEKAGTPSL